MKGPPTAENACGTSAEQLGRPTPGSWDLLGRINVMKTWRINLGINEFIYKLDDDDVSVSCQLFYFVLPLVFPAGLAVRGRTCRTLIGQPFKW